jgi:hypothetical protein
MVRLPATTKSRGVCNPDHRRVSLDRLGGGIAMSADAAAWIVLAAGAYLVAGLVVALLCLARGLERLDNAARDMPRSARALVLPGLVALWPLMLLKCLRRTQPPVS